MRQAASHPPAAEEQAHTPLDIDTMRETADLLLGPDALLPAIEVDTLALTLRGHLELLIPGVEWAVGPRPNNVAQFCALACVGEARGKLSVTPRLTLESRVAHARRLARSLNALCDHFERLGGERP